MNSIEPRLNRLPLAQRRLWDELSELPRHFVLYGGTALVLRLGGRESEDFDFFTSESIDAHELGRTLKFLHGAELLQAAPETATFLADRGGRVKVSFFGGLSFGRVGEPDVCRENGLQVASLLDLAAQKLKVIQVRPAGKDYRDIETMLRNGVSLERALGAARALYPDFAPLLSLKALTYFGDGDLPELPEETKDFLARSAASVGEIESVERMADQLSGYSDD